MESKNRRKKWKRAKAKRKVLVENPNFSTYFLSGKKWRWLLNPEIKTREKKKKEKARKKKKKAEKKKKQEEFKKMSPEERKKQEEERKKKREKEKEESQFDREKGGRNRPNPFLRQRRFRNRQKAVATVANEIKDQARELYHRCFPFSSTLPPIRLFWGDGSFSHTGHGHPPCPNKGLRDRLEPFFSGPVVMLSERNTSKTSPCCSFSFGDKNLEKNKYLEEPAFAGVQLIDKKPGKQRAFRCMRVEEKGVGGKGSQNQRRCNRPWHRDIGASLNMYRNWTFQQDLKVLDRLEFLSLVEDDLPMEEDLPNEDLSFDSDWVM
mmetsp:Transcript_36926/g.58059  ORF Transcript_36926/g.58059 Transcript_36926/m.58059 type:complete len:321 (-) Transcript_36926:783-1745(-)